MLQKVIPFEKLELLKIRHYRRSDVAKGNSPSVVDVNEAIRAGIDYSSPKSKRKSISFEGVPCWRSLLNNDTLPKNEQDILKRISTDWDVNGNASAIS